MADDRNIAQAAQYMAERYEAKASLDIMLQDFAPTTIEEAYNVQAAFLGLLGKTRGPLGGYKIAYTSAEMQRLRGISSPCAGGMFAATIQSSPATFDSAHYVQLAIECEVAARIGTDVPLSNAPYTQESLANYIEFLAAAFEMVDRRAAAPGTGNNAAAIGGICTNISNAGAVLGPSVTDWRSLDLVSARGTMVINGELVGEGLGSDVMGHPLEPLVWLVNMLAESGTTLKTGTTILTGSIIPPQPLKAGDTATVAFGALGEAHVKVI